MIQINFTINEWWLFLEREAERLVIHGFYDPVVRELPIEDVKRQLREVIERKVSK
ncbi:hypothetical protein ACVNP0_00600 [Staphylococcus aureus]